MTSRSLRSEEPTRLWSEQHDEELSESSSSVDKEEDDDGEGSPEIPAEIEYVAWQLATGAKVQSQKSWVAKTATQKRNIK